MEDDDEGRDDDDDARDDDDDASDDDDDVYYCSQGRRMMSGSWKQVSFLMFIIFNFNVRIQYMVIMMMMNMIWEEIR